MSEAGLVTAGLDPYWVARAVSSAGDGAAEATFVEFVGTGQMSRMARFALDWSGGDGPASALVKLPSAVAGTREVAFKRGFYRKECEFYRAVTADLEVCTPRTHHAHFDPGELDFAIVMEDVATHAPGDQLSAAPIDHIEGALVQAAALHAGCWGRTSGDAFEAYREEADAEVARTERTFPAMVDQVTDRWGDLIETPVADFVGRLVPSVGTWRRLRSRPVTLVHGDFRPDNLLFGPPGDARPVIVVDWQLATIGLPALDVAFLIGGALSSDERQAHERRLIDGYLASLSRRGVDIDVAQFLEDYALATVHGIVVAIGAATMVDRTERGEALLSMMLNRHGNHALDWNPLPQIEAAT